MHKPLLDVLAGQRQAIPPVWMMRQAGRYLPEYRAVRAKAGGFLDLCFTPELAADVTLQPIRRFGFDAAILFSDILVIPHALGQRVSFVEGEGPRLPPLTSVAMIDALPQRHDPSVLAPVYETVRRVKSELPDGVTLIGFCGAPWTVATYMIAGRGTPDQAPARDFAAKERDAFQRLVDRLVENSAEYLINQLEAGAEVLQLFDTWASVLRGEDFIRWSVEPARRIIELVRARKPDTKFIGFPRGVTDALPDYVARTKVNAVSLGTHIDKNFARENVQSLVPVQGNLDPEILRAGGDDLDRAVDEVIEAFAAKPFIFNLGHGILPDTPIAHVERMLARVRNSR